MTDALLIIAPRKPERFDEVERSARRGGWNVARRTELRVDAEPRARRRRARHDRRAGAAVPGRDRGVRRRQPRRRRRPQYPRAGGVRQANRVWPAHAELRRDRARRSSTTARRSRSGPAASSSTSLLELLGDPVRRASLGAAARALVEANRGARGKTWRVIAEVLPPEPARRPCAAFRRGAADTMRGELPDDRGHVLSALYAALARRRRERYARRPDLRRRLRHPVISIGNLAVGGRGKTPLAALRRAAAARDGGAAGDPEPRLRPAATPDDGVVVVRDRDGHPRRSRSRRRRAADARAAAAGRDRARLRATAISPARLPSTTSAPRSTCSTTASSTCSSIATSTIVHRRAARISRGRADAAVRAPARAARRAASRPTRSLALDDEALARGPAARNAPFETSRRRRRVGDARRREELTPSRAAASRSLAVAGIAGPSAFFDGLRARRAGRSRGRWRFRDHHPLLARATSTRDRSRPPAAPGATRVLTTEKDVVRLLPFRPFPLPVGVRAAYNGAGAAAGVPCLAGRRARGRARVADQRD